jgi:type I restriction enzyme, S subunit
MNWPTISLSEVLQLVRREEAPQAGTVYRQVGVRLWGNGAYERESIDGSQTKYPALYKAVTGDIVVNKIWARNGSVAVIPHALDGTWGSAEFPLFSPDTTRLLPRWMHWITKSPWFWHECDEHAKGTSGKNRIKPEQFLSIKIPLPPLEDQKRIAARIDALQQKLHAASALQEAIDKDVDKLLAERFQDTLNGAAWRPMREVAPLVKRQVDLEPNRLYKELGARSFGKGLFIKPDFDSAKATWEKPVWIKAGDLVFSNIKAWEGAIGVALPEHDGYIASHRYLTAVVKSELILADYLLHFLFTEQGLLAVNEASPGTADRNRTTKKSVLEMIQVPVPPIAVQRQFIGLKNKLAQAAIERAKQKTLTEALVPALVSKLIGQA